MFFWVLDRSPLSGPVRGPPFCNNTRNHYQLATATPGFNDEFIWAIGHTGVDRLGPLAVSAGMHTEWLAVQGWYIYTVEGTHQPKTCYLSISIPPPKTSYLSISIPPPKTSYLSISIPPQANWEQENENTFWVSWASQLALVVKNQPANDSSHWLEFNPGSGRSPGGGQDNPLQISCLENPMDRGAWWDTVPMVAELDTAEVT